MTQEIESPEQRKGRGTFLRNAGLGGIAWAFATVHGIVLAMESPPAPGHAPPDWNGSELGLAGLMLFVGIVLYRMGQAAVKGL